MTIHDPYEARNPDTWFRAYVGTDPHDIRMARPDGTTRYIGTCPDPEDTELIVGCLNAVEKMRQAGVKPEHITAVVERFHATASGG